MLLYTTWYIHQTSHNTTLKQCHLTTKFSSPIYYKPFTSLCVSNSLVSFPNSSKTFHPADILSIRNTNQKQNTHTHVNTHALSLYGPQTQHVFLWIFNAISLWQPPQQNNPLLNLTSCISWHEQATDLTAQCNKHHEMLPAQSRYCRMITYHSASPHSPPSNDYLCLSSSHKHGTFQTELKL